MLKILMPLRIDQNQNRDVKFFVAYRRNPDVDCDENFDVKWTTN
jgi:hypothetical protein